MLALLLTWSLGAAAQDQYRVVVLEPAAPTPLESELLARLKGELGAAGFEVLSLPRTPGIEPERAAASLGSEVEPAAVFATGNAGGAPGAGSALELWLSDRVEGALIRQGVQGPEGSAAASLLAVQGVELLRARVANWRLQPPPRETAAVSVSPPVPSPAELMAALDLGLLFDSASGGAALTPLLRLSYGAGVARGDGWGIDLGARLSVAWLGLPVVLQAPERDVEVIQNLALLEGVLALQTGGWLRPFGSLGAGAYRVNVEGIGRVATVIGRTEDTFTPIAGLGLGLALHPLRHWVAHVEAQGLFALRPTAIDIDATRIATFGRPLFVFSIGVGVVL